MAKGFSKEEWHDLAEVNKITLLCWEQTELWIWHKLGLYTDSQVVFTVTTGQIWVSEMLINVPKIIYLVRANDCTENAFGFYNLSSDQLHSCLERKRLKCVRGCVLDICLWDREWRISKLSAQSKTNFKILLWIGRPEKFLASEGILNGAESSVAELKCIE